MGMGYSYQFAIKSKKLRRKIKVCQKCKVETYFLGCHHKDFNKHNNATSNLIVVCHSCHAKLHFNTYMKNSRFNFSIPYMAKKCGVNSCSFSHYVYNGECTGKKVKRKIERYIRKCDDIKLKTEIALARNLPQNYFFNTP